MKKASIALLWLASIIAAYTAGFRHIQPEAIAIIETRTDTVRIMCPEVTAIYVRGQSIEKLPVAYDSTGSDSVEVAVPISQAVYTGDYYRAYVSGFRPRLDSLVFAERHISISPAARKPSRWSVGLQAGYGITPRGFQPYIGIGVSFRIL